MEEYIAFDSHKRYTWVEHEQVASGALRQYRVNHAPGAIPVRSPGAERVPSWPSRPRPTGTGLSMKSSEPVACPGWCIRAKPS